MKVYIDIHNHTLFGVDDGPEELKESVAMLEHAFEQGIEAVILTPHYRHGMFAYRTETVEQHFSELKAEADRIGIAVYLGCEYHVNSQMIEALRSGKVHSLADTDYVLTEYSYETEYSYISEHTNRLISCGYIPVIAHVERYECFIKKPQLCEELSNRGAYIQINADSVLGLAGKMPERCCKKLLKNEWADIVASDSHDLEERRNNMARCYQFVAKKYGEHYAGRLFYRNPKKIIQDASVHEL